MAIEKLLEFAKDGQKNTDDLNLTDGFPVSKKPARQWFNWLFNSLTSKVNEIIDAEFIPKAEIVDNLTTNDATKPVSAAQAKNLQDNKLEKNANAVSATKLQTARTIAISGAVTGTATSFDGSGNIAIATTAIDGSEISTGTIPAARIPAASTSAAGAVKLNNTLTSTSTTEALTAAQGKILNDQAFGVGVDYYDVTSLRVKGTIYTATGSKPRQLCIDVESSGGSNGDILFVRKNDLSPWMPIAQRGSGSRTIFPIILPGYQYKYESPTNFSKWIEVY